jgi:capsid assembly protease
MRQREQRPKGHAYIDELRLRFGARPHSCRMDMVSSGPGDQRTPYEVCDGIAMIDVCGVLTSEAWYEDETEYDDIIDEITMAVSDVSVRGILLCVDSPGGDTDGAFECADAIVAAGKQKPIRCAVDTIAYSAGYLIASCADIIYVPPVSGGVGSVGVYSAHVDYSGALDQAGIAVTLISAGKGKTDYSPYAPLSDAAKRRIQADVDRLYGEFVGRVCKRRSMSIDRLTKDLGAGMFNGSADALTSGLADRVGSPDTACSELLVYLEMSSSSTMISIPGSAASASAPSQKKEAVQMADPIQADATEAPPVTDPSPAPIAAPAAAASTAPTVEQMTTAARAEGYAQAHEIVELCVIANRPAAAADMIRRNLTPAQARSELLTARAEADPEIHSHITPEAGLSASGENPLLADARKRAQAAKKEAK